MDLLLALRGEANILSLPSQVVSLELFPRVPVITHGPALVPVRFAAGYCLLGRSLLPVCGHWRGGRQAAVIPIYGLYLGTT